MQGVARARARKKNPVVPRELRLTRAAPLPSHGRSFRRSGAERILREVLEEKMAFTNERDKKGRLSFVYNSDDSGETIREIVEDCQNKVIAMMKAQAGPPRYKFVFQATMGENHQQMVRNASRCLWDSEIDNCASAYWTNGRVYAVATCFALYYE